MTPLHHPTRPPAPAPVGAPLPGAALRTHIALTARACVATTLGALAVASTAVTPAPGSAQSAPRDPSVLARTDSVFASMTGPTSPGCALSVMEGGALAYERGYGMANVEYGIPITPRSVFHVASVSKHFTAMAVELLVNEGKVSWDDDVRTYVPEVPDFGEPVTLRHLVHHVSGIRDQWNLLSMSGWRWEADVVTQKDVLDITSRQTALNFGPGERYMYSNTGFTLLAVVVERVSGQTLKEFAEERIFGPLGMERTHFHDDHETVVPDRAYAYEPDGDGVYGLKLSIPDFDVVGATSLFTTVHDLAAWDRNFYTGRVGGREALERLHARFVLNDGDTTDYAHGLGHGEYRGLPTVGHGGADAGYRSHFLRFPEQEWTVAVLCNFPSSNPGSLARRVADVWLADAFTEPAGDDAAAETPGGPSAFVDLPRERLEALAGLYRKEEGFEVLRIVLEGDTLELDAGPGLVLRPLGDDRFHVRDAGIVVTLRPARGDRPRTLELPEGAGGDVYRGIEAWDPGPTELAAFAGIYHSEELDTRYRFEVEGDSLVFRHRKLDDETLTPAFRDAFEMGGRTVEFTRDREGAVDGFRISDGRVQNVVFARVEGTR